MNRLSAIGIVALTGTTLTALAWLAAPSGKSPAVPVTVQRAAPKLPAILGDKSPIAQIVAAKVGHDLAAAHVQLPSWYHTNVSKILFPAAFCFAEGTPFDVIAYYNQL